MATSMVYPIKIPTRVQPVVKPDVGDPGVYTNKLHYFETEIIDKMWKKPFAVDFLQPVDTVLLGAPTYYKIIETPMDLGTIKQRLEHNYYHNVAEALEDFKLITRNCFRFNKRRHVVYRRGQNLNKFFKAKMKHMPKGPEVPHRKYFPNADPETPVPLAALLPQAPIQKPALETDSQLAALKLQQEKNICKSITMETDQTMIKPIKTQSAAVQQQQRHFDENHEKLKEQISNADTMIGEFFMPRLNFVIINLEKSRKTVENLNFITKSLIEEYHQRAKEIQEIKIKSPVLSLTNSRKFYEEAKHLHTMLNNLNVHKSKYPRQVKQAMDDWNDQFIAMEKKMQTIESNWKAL